MASYLRPRRGKKATAEAQNIILKRGEVFFETPTTGVGTGIGKIKIGDGTSTYSNLPYFLEQGSQISVDTALSTSSTNPVQNKIVTTKINELDTTISSIQTSFQNGCSTIANAITANGVSTASTASPNTMATNINTVATNKYNAGVTATKVGNATTAHVLSGKTFTNGSGVGLSGGMVNRAAWTSTPTASTKVTIPAGYHNGSGYVDTSKVYTAGTGVDTIVAKGFWHHCNAEATVSCAKNDTFLIILGLASSSDFTFSGCTTTSSGSMTDSYYSRVFYWYKVKATGTSIKVINKTTTDRTMLIFKY